jgi:hypothetical protein
MRLTYAIKLVSASNRLRTILSQRIVDVLEGKILPDGCGSLAFNTGMELGPHDRDFQRVMGQHIAIMRLAVTAYIKQGRAWGRFADLARIFA